MMQKNKKLISIIIPCYNEEERIGPTLEAVSEFTQEQNQKYYFEIIIVNNGSKDRTQKKALAYKDRLPSFQILSENSHGKGWAVKQGMLTAKGDWRLFMDADNSTDIRQLEKLMQATEEGYDVVVSSRRLPLSHIMHHQPFFREMLGDIFAALVRMIIPLGIKDTQNGFKLFSRQAAEKIFPHQSMYYWAFDVEILAIAKLFKYKIKEVPITWVNDEESKMNFKGMITMLAEVLETRLRLWTQQYSKPARPIDKPRLTGRAKAGPHARFAKIKYHHKNQKKVAPLAQTNHL